MHAAEIVIGEVQRDSSCQVRQLLAECIREPRKSSHRHTHRQVLPLHERSADVVGIGIALSDFGYNPRDAWWGIPRFGRIKLPVVAKHFRELREVHVRTKALRDGHGVVVQSVRGELHAVGEALIQVPQERPCIGSHALANAKRRHQLGFRVNRNVNPLVAKLRRVSASHVPALLADVAPDFVNLQIPGAEVLHLRIHQSCAALSGHDEQAHDCVAIQPCEALCTADRAPLKKAMQRPLYRLRIREEQIAGQLRVRFAESGMAGSAAPTLNAALTEVAELVAGLVLAFGAGHGVSPLALSGETSHNVLGSEAWVTPRFGLAPQPVSAGSGAFSQLASFGGGRVIGFHLSFPRGHLGRGLSCFTKLASFLSGFQSFLPQGVHSFLPDKETSASIAYHFNQPSAFPLDEASDYLMNCCQRIFLFERDSALQQFIPNQGGGKATSRIRLKKLCDSFCDTDARINPLARFPCKPCEEPSSNLQCLYFLLNKGLLLVKRLQPSLSCLQKAIVIKFHDERKLSQ
jgi:hypothetical protein